MLIALLVGVIGTVTVTVCDFSAAFAAIIIFTFRILHPRLRLSATATATARGPRVGMVRSPPLGRLPSALHNFDMMVHLF